MYTAEPPQNRNQPRLSYMRHHKYDGIFPSEWGLKITVSGWPRGALAAWQKMASFYGAVIIYHSLKVLGRSVEKRSNSQAIYRRHAGVRDA